MHWPSRLLLVATLSSLAFGGCALQPNVRGGGARGIPGEFQNSKDPMARLFEELQRVLDAPSDNVSILELSLLMGRILDRNVDVEAVSRSVDEYASLISPQLAALSSPS